MAKPHVPAPGRASGLTGVALCGEWGEYRTGDHDLLRRLAAADTEGRYCAECVRALRAPSEPAPLAERGPAERLAFAVGRIAGRLTGALRSRR